MSTQMVTVTRNIPAIQIPSGDKIEIPATSQVRITQNLGGTCTVVTDQGLLARVAGDYFDALGIVPAVSEDTGPKENLTKEEVEKRVWEELKTCFDPEIPVNVVDLGLIYKSLVEPVDGGFQVLIDMTLTAPGCGMGPILQNDVETKVSKIPSVKSTRVYLVFDPPWDQSMMSEAARLQLGFF